MKSYHIHIKGRVQGIGFRPFIYNLAVENNLKGNVSNTLDGVHITINCELCSISKFVNKIKEKSPSYSLITDIHVKEIESRTFSDFSIVDSDIEGIPDLLITPDFAMCDNCKKELRDHKNRRFGYPFITCTHCGPRYSIEKGLPYDRYRTSMETFKMCPTCQEEYSSHADIRFYSQTNSCPDCKISQWLVDSNGRIVDVNEEDIVDFASEKITEGMVLAMKGIGGFLLICDAQNHEKVMKLRNKKHRPSKPFALLYPNLGTVKNEFEISKYELDELRSEGAPIVLLKPLNDKKSASLLPVIAPGLDRLGVMIPYAPILLLIAEKVNRPLIATSGNIKGSPIIYNNNEAVNSLSGFADYLLLNNRDIQVPQDDSVAKFSNKYNQKVVIRRSRGFAPGYFQKSVEDSFEERVLAMGALLKSTFCIWNQARCHVSQFLGDTLEFDAQVSYERTLNHLMELLQFKPDVIIIDKHPAYYSSQLGRELAASREIPLYEIQHHKAHFWSVLGENNLIDNDERILGVVLDGTGMGNDGAVWGGEFFIYENYKIKRSHHLHYFPHILGDKMAREPKLAALSLLHATKVDYDLRKDKFSDEEVELYDKVLEDSSLCTSSMGRVFDAVSSLLDFCHVNTYEGEAAMYLECEAQKFINNSNDFRSYYPFEIHADGSIDLVKLTSGIINDVLSNCDKGEIAAKFHITIVEMISEIVIRSKVKSLAFSGGVFQNGLLLDLLIEQLGDDYRLIFHKDLSPNDECISYGQLVAYYAKQKSRSLKKAFSKTKKLV